MVFYVIGLGLSDAKDVSCRGLEVIKNCKKVFLEAYTSVLLCPTADLEAFYGRTDLIEADRTMVEQQSDVMFEHAKEADVAFLVVGDPLSATTHTDLILRAVEMGIPYRVLHNASIMNAIGCTGLQLYNFGETISMCFWEDNWKPTSYFDKILKNRKQGYHTLCLLDIKMKEQNVENLMRGNSIFEPPRYMTCQQAAIQLLEILENPKYENCGIAKDQLVIGVSKVGSEKQKIVSCSIEKMAEQNWLGAPLHSLVLPSEVVHDLEMDFVKTFSLKE
jgi:diphthine synthase